MKKINFVLFFTLIFLINNCLGQKYSKIVYKVSKDSLFLRSFKNNVNGDKLKQAVYDSFIEDEKLTFTLIFDKNASLFTFDNKKDYPYKEFSVYQLYDFYNEFKTTKQLRLERNFHIIYPHDKNKWEIIPNQKKRIGKFNCILAKIPIENLILHVWFTPDIPISTGPGRYFGLPGLILEINNIGKSTIYASKISLNDPTIKTFPKIPTARVVNEEELKVIFGGKIKSK